MAITVGVDSYVTVEEATEYITGHYLSSDDQRKTWEEMTDDDREVCLRRACMELEQLAYRGVKFAFPQPLAFPRYFGANYAMINGVLYAPETDIYPELKEVPDAVKWAQIEESLEIASPGASSEYKDAVTGPVANYTIGHLSETFREASEGSVDGVIASAAAKELIAPYLWGGFNVR